MNPAKTHAHEIIPFQMILLSLMEKKRLLFRSSII